MPPCPQCHNEITKRKNDACPICGQAISLHQGHFFRTEDGARNMAIITTFEKLAGQQLSRANNRPTPFRFNRKSPSFRVEQKTAERILAECEFDLDLANRTLAELFHNPAWSWKTRASLSHLTKDLPAALAIARVAADLASQDQARQMKLADQLACKEDVFG
jgi:hypothetical protein